MNNLPKLGHPINIAFRSTSEGIDFIGRQITNIIIHFFPY